MTSRYAKPFSRNLKAKGTSIKTASLTAAVIAGAALLSACGQNEEPLAQQARAAQYPSEIASVIEGMDVADETFDIPKRVQEEGTVIVLWRENDLFANDGAAVVYRYNSGTLVPLRVCPLPGTDIYDSGKNEDHHRISHAIDDLTTSVRCETKEEASNRGRPNPMLIVNGKSGGFLGMGDGDPSYREFGVL